jgi:1,4-alpha-glucan branching enzyme
VQHHPSTLRSVIRRNTVGEQLVKVTFSLPDRGEPVAVVADFNDWDPSVHPMRRRSNGTRSVAVVLAAGSTIRFRYHADRGEWSEWFDDPEADGYEPNGFGQSHAVLQA